MGSQDSDDDDVPALLSAKPQLTRAPARIGARGAPRGQMVDPNSIPAGCAPAILTCPTAWEWSVVVHSTTGSCL